jgi:ParB family chromosome partitioning protein
VQNIKLDELELEKISVIPTFNVRDDYGEEESNDLQESIKATNGNIQPIIVHKLRDKYELISGERRLRALKATGFEKALVIVYDNLTDLQKNELMFNENMGRKHLTWQEEVKALKRLQILGYEINALFLRKKGTNGQKVFKLLEALHAVEEFPDLLNEKTRKSCLIKYRKRKREEEGIASIHKISINKVIEKDAIKRKKIDSAIIEELKAEVAHYKQQVKDKNIFKLIKESDKIQRLSEGIWLSDEIKSLIEASRTCESFGKLNEDDEECKECKKEDPNVYAKCEFYRDEIENG